MPHNTRPEPLPRKPDPKSERPRKRKRVTIIAAFQCRDGLLMCADSEQTIASETKSQTRKIHLFKTAPYTVAIGGAGDGSLIDYIQYELQQRVALKPPAWDTVDSWLQAFCVEMWDACMGPYRGFNYNHVPEEPSFLIGLQTQGEYRVYKWEHRIIYPVPNWTPASIGAGIIQSETLLNELQFGLPLMASQMFLFAVRMMLKVKQLVQGCGGKTEMVLLRTDGGLTVISTKKIDEVEELVEQMDTFFVDQILHFISGGERITREGDLKEECSSLWFFRHLS